MWSQRHMKFEAAWKSPLQRRNIKQFEAAWKSPHWWFSCSQCDYKGATCNTKIFVSFSLVEINFCRSRCLSRKFRTGRNFQTISGRSEIFGQAHSSTMALSKNFGRSGNFGPSEIFGRLHESAYYHWSKLSLNNYGYKFLSPYTGKVILVELPVRIVVF